MEALDDILNGEYVREIEAYMLGIHKPEFDDWEVYISESGDNNLFFYKPKKK